jgi:hypothetical protein
MKINPSVKTVCELKSSRRLDQFRLLLYYHRASIESENKCSKSSSCIIVVVFPWQHNRNYSESEAMELISSVWKCYKVGGMY